MSAETCARKRQRAITATTSLAATCPDIGTTKMAVLMDGIRHKRRAAANRSGERLSQKSGNNRCMFKQQAVVRREPALPPHNFFRFGCLKPYSKTRAPHHRCCCYVSSTTRLRDTQNAIAGRIGLNHSLGQHYSTAVVQVHDHVFYEGCKENFHINTMYDSRNNTRAQCGNRRFNGSKVLFPNTRHLVK